MPSPMTGMVYVCRHYAHAWRLRAPAKSTRRSRYYSMKRPEAEAKLERQFSGATSHGHDHREEPGPMARRLEEATEEALFEGGRAGLKAVEDAGFSDELKERLLAKVKDAQFRSDNASAFAEAGITNAAGEGTKQTAASEAWTGEESQSDAVLRMLSDAHKPLPHKSRGKPITPQPKPVDMRMRRDRRTPGQRAVSAREKASIYAGLGMNEKDRGLSDEEREAMKKELRDRFAPAARAVPSTISGLQALANERIEDAIARGQFKNIPRGTGVERDARADNPFIDTTEYIMNKMIKRQDIVPPWIEKQQEVVKAAHVFRARLRNDWKRHAARTIASHGGSLEQQVERARCYAQAEQIYNPRRRNVDQISVPTISNEDAVTVAIRQQDALVPDVPPSNPPATANSTAPDDESFTAPFRDPDWIRIEKSYMDLAINNLNSLTRSYNLMAPELAKKPYFNLERELDNCFADVAPQLADFIKDRAARPRSLVESVPHKPGGILERFGKEGHRSKIYDSKAPHYGFKEMWKDLFS